MKYPHQVWEQLKNKTPSDFISALNRQLGGPDEINGSEHIYRFPDGRRVSIHYHKKRCYGPSLLKKLLEQIDWTEKEMKKYKFL